MPLAFSKRRPFFIVFTVIEGPRGLCGLQKPPKYHEKQQNMLVGYCYNKYCILSTSVPRIGIDSECLDTEKVIRMKLKIE